MQDFIPKEKKEIQNNQPQITNKAQSQEQWVILQNWTECSVACGGGKSYQQRKCIKGQCAGQALLIKECNVQPCSQEIQVIDEKVSKEVEMHEVPLFQRKRRFEMCIVKEDDMLIKVDKALIPVRIILNKFTLSIFTDQSFQSVVKTIDLPFLNIKFDSKDEKCLILTDSRDNKKDPSLYLCIWPAAIISTNSIQQEREKFIQDIESFKNKCQQYQVDKFQPQTDRIKKMIDIEMEKQVLDQAGNNDIVKDQNSVNKEVQMLEKEALLEERKFKEEKEAEKKQFDYIRSKLLETKEEQQMLEQKLLQSSDKLSSQTTENPTFIQNQNSNEILASLEKEIQLKRKTTDMTLAAMRRAAVRKKRLKIQELLEIKAKLTEKFLDEDRQGNISNCDARNDQTKRVKWCWSNYEKDEKLLDTCLKRTSMNKDFCYQCCDQEFGILHIDNRKKCYSCCGNNNADTNSTNDDDFIDIPPLGKIPEICLDKKNKDISIQCLKTLKLKQLT